MSTADTERIRAAVLARVQQTEVERRIVCADALAVAEELGVSPAEVGRCCNDEGIKVRSCQLGCF